MKKKYMKPNSGNILSYVEGEKITPFAAGAALLVGYAAGRAVKQAFEADASANKIKKIRKVVVY